jgi:branched-chain amino acid transport system substrate-binding protein
MVNTSVGRKRALATVLMMVVALAVAACGGSDQGGSKSAASSGGSGSKSPIVVAIACQCTIGSLAPGASQTAQGAQLWGEWISSKGGINGTPVKVITYDDQGDPAKSTSNMHKAIDSDKADVILNDTPLDNGWAPYAEAKKIPVIGLASYNPTTFGKLTMFFPADTQQPGFAWAAAQVLKAKGAKKTSIIACTETPACAANVEGYKKFAKALGVPNVYVGKAPSSAPDYAAPCLGAKQAGAEGVYLGMGADVAIRVVQSCAKQNYRPQFYEGGGSIPKNAWDDPAVIGHLTSNGGGVPWADAAGNPAVQEIIDAATKFKPEYLAERAPQISNGWTAGKMIEKALENAKGEVTPKTVLDGLLSFNNETLGGISMAAMTFNKSGPQPFMPCVFTVTVGNKAVNGAGDSQCMPEALASIGGLPTPGGVLKAK